MKKIQITLGGIFFDSHCKLPTHRCWNWPKRTGGLSGLSGGRMSKCLKFWKDWNLKPIFTQKWASVDMNWGFNPQPPTIPTLQHTLYYLPRLPAVCFPRWRLVWWYLRPNRSHSTRLSRHSMKQASCGFSSSDHDALQTSLYSDYLLPTRT